MFFCDTCLRHFYSEQEKEAHEKWMHSADEDTTGGEKVSDNEDMMREQGMEIARKDSIDIFSSESLPPSGSFKLSMSVTESEGSQGIPLGQRVKVDLGLDESSESDSEELETTAEGDDEDEEEGPEDDIGEKLKKIVGLNDKKQNKKKTMKARQKTKLKTTNSETLLERLKRKKKEKEDLIKEMERTDETLGTMKKSKELRNTRLEILANTINRQQVELFRQSKEKEEGGEQTRYEFVDTKEINEGIRKIKKSVEGGSEDIERFNGKKTKLDLIKTKNLRDLDKKWEKVVIMCPGHLEEQQKSYKAELGRMKNIEIVPCVDESIKKMVGVLKNIETKGEKESKVGVCLLKYGKEDDEDEERTKNEIKKIMGQLMIVLARGKEKFGEIVVVIPAATGKNWKSLKMLEEEVLEKVKDDHIISLIGEQLEMGKKDSEEKGAGAEVWKKEDLVFANRYGKEEEENGLLMNQYVFHRCLARLARVNDPQGEAVTGCLDCGFEHAPDEVCLLNEQEEDNKEAII